MLVNTQTTLALRCVSCGKLDLMAASRFHMHSTGSLRLHCACGSLVATVGRKAAQVWIQIPCYLCDGIHFLYFSLNEFWSDEVKELNCAETDLQLGVLGGSEAVSAYANPTATALDRLLEDSAFDDYFDHREVMYQALGHIQTLTDEGKVNCKCGGRQIAIDIFPDRLELSCEDCGQSRVVFARTQDDLELLQHQSRLDVGGDGTSRRRGHKK